MSDMSQISWETSDFMAAFTWSDFHQKPGRFPFRESEEDILWRTKLETDEWSNEAFELRACPAVVGPKLHEIGKPSCRGSNRHYIH